MTAAIASAIAAEHHGQSKSAIGASPSRREVMERIQREIEENQKFLAAVR
jgi:hypothetical protein